MEHESFEDKDIAKLLNDKFVSIKVDREERPDVDKMYMNFVTVCFFFKINFFLDDFERTRRMANECFFDSKS